jgi:hypothetical protein
MDLLFATGGRAMEDLERWPGGGKVVRAIAALILGALFLAVPTVAQAEPVTPPGGRVWDDGFGNVQIQAKSQSNRHRTSGATGVTSSDPEQRRAAALAAERRIKAEIATYRAAFAAWQACLNQTPQIGQVEPSCSPPQGWNLGPRPPAALSLDPTAGGPPRIRLSAEQVAYIAVARLHLDPLTPVIGPPPELNRWQMAAVGYPLWLSGAGNSDPAPVSDAVFNLLVRLDAHVTHTDFVMGDGHLVTCSGAGLAWTRTVAPGQKSPACGYQYATPSLPTGDYTVTIRTHWDIGWTINNQTGVIRMVQASSTQLPVGELQVLVR